MKKEIIYKLTENFEDSAHKTEEGVEFWFARDLQHLLGYDTWRSFFNVINKAKTACQISKQSIPDHFADIGKMVSIGSGAKKEIDDIMLTRYACYLIAQNGDPKKSEISFAQTYFAIQTRKAEIIEQNILESERLNARQKLSQTEKELSSVINQLTGDNRNFAIIRSKGDQALFNHTTQQMKIKYKSKNKPIADFMPTILLKAKDFATEITIHNAKENKMKSENQISNEHIINNKSVRKTLLSRGIVPENLPPEEDIKKVERKLNSQTKKSLNNNKNFRK